MGLESFRKAVSSPERLKFIGVALRLGAARDEAEGPLVLPMAFVQVSDVTEPSVLNVMSLTTDNHTLRLSSFTSHLSEPHSQVQCQRRGRLTPSLRHRRSSGKWMSQTLKRYQYVSAHEF